MKTKLFSILALASAFLMLTTTSCQDKPEEPKKDSALVAPTLAVAPGSLVIEEYTDAAALTFTWNDAAKASGFKDSNGDGTYDDADGCSIAYSLQITKASDEGFTSGTYYNVAAMTEPSKAFSSNELAALASEIGADIRAGFDLIARIRVTAEGMDAVLSNVVTATVGQKPFDIQHLYPIGEATQWGWSQDGAEEMTNNNGIFTWTGHLYANAEFKFLCQVDGQWWPGIVRVDGATEYWTAKLGVEDADDCKFKVGESGTYTVTIDAKNSNAITISVQFVEADPEIVVTELYVLGSACKAGWSLDQMEAFENNDGIFTWTGVLYAAGEFRFPLQKKSNVWWPCLMITADGSGIAYGTSDSEKQIYNVEEDGVYEIVIDARNFNHMSYTLTLKSTDLGFTKILPVGSAFSWGWSTGSAEEMTTTNGEVYTWTGDLKADGSTFKFLIGGNDWIPSLNRDATASEYWTLVRRNTYDEPDEQFSVSEAGKYTITLNISALTIKVEKVQ